MTDRTLTPNDVALQLSRLARQLDDLVGQIDAAERHAVTVREATVATHVQRLAAEASEQVVKGIRRQIDSVKMRVDVGRSLGAALRAELATIGGQP